MPRHWRVHRRRTVQSARRCRSRGGRRARMFVGSGGGVYGTVAPRRWAGVRATAAFAPPGALADGFRFRGDAGHRGTGAAGACQDGQRARGHGVGVKQEAATGNSSEQ